MIPKDLIVRKIKEGTVIDHIPAGQVLNVMKILRIRGTEDYSVAMVMNVESEKLGKKDMLKVENRELDADEVNKISLLAPEATISTIKNYRVVKKMKVRLPDEIKGILNCTNPNCISNQLREPAVSSFRVISRSPTLLACQYCGTYVSQEDVVAQYAKL